jgi:hypothetical protein
MDTLLGQVLEAHGGLERWRRYNKVEATIVTGGGLFPLKGVLQDRNPRPRAPRRQCRLADGFIDGLRPASTKHWRRRTFTPTGSPEFPSEQSTPRSSPGIRLPRKLSRTPVSLSREATDTDARFPQEGSRLTEAWSRSHAVARDGSYLAVNCGPDTFANSVLGWTSSGRCTVRPSA